MRTRSSSAIRSGVPVGIVSGMLAGATGSTARDSFSDEGGTHREALASSRGASSPADWPNAAEAPNSREMGRHQETRPTYIIFYLDSPSSGAGARGLLEIRYSRSPHQLSTLALNLKALPALPEPFV